MFNQEVVGISKLLFVTETFSKECNDLLVCILK